MCWVFVIHVWVVAAIPFDISLGICEATPNQSTRYDLAATVISEHSGSGRDYSLTSLWLGSEHKRPTYEPDSMSPTGALGVWQLWGGWAAEFGYPREALTDVGESTAIAAQVVEYFLASHKKCKGSHHWVAHYKCTKRARNDTTGACAYAQRKWLAIRQSLVSFY